MLALIDDMFCTSLSIVNKQLFASTAIRPRVTDDALSHRKRAIAVHQHRLE
jgi:hypothetical protein